MHFDAKDSGSSILSATWQVNHDVLMPRDPTKDEKSRIGFYLDWLAQTHTPWYEPLFDAYGGYLLHDRTRIDPRSGYPKRAVLSPATVKAHLATMRGRYESILRDNRVRQQLYDLAPGGSPADRKAFVDEFLMRIHNAIHPSNSEIKITTIQDTSDESHLRLKPEQVRALIRAPGLETLPGLRDTAAIVLMACTGIREAELVALNVDDLRQTMGGELALRVRGGKGRKQRLVPYGPLDWCLLYVERWLDAAEIRSGAIFRGFYKGYKTVRPTRLTERAVNLIMNQYPIPIDGDMRAVQPHDLRRTYARNAYEHGMDLERIRQNLGHVSLHTTQTYIGTLDAAQRRPPAMFNPPHRLSDWQRK